PRWRRTGPRARPSPATPPTRTRAGSCPTASRAPGSRLSRWSASSLFAALLFVPSAAADVRLEVSGAVLSAPPFVEVRVDLTNRGDAVAHAVTIEAELLGGRERTGLEGDLRQGQTRGTSLCFVGGSTAAGVLPS